MALDIKVDGISLELYPNEEDNFYITKQLHDLRDLKTRNATFSKEITVPNVGNNSALLRQYLPEYSHLAPTSVKYSSVDVFIEDIPVIEDAILFSAQYNRTTKAIAITILGGDQEFFNQLSDAPIADLFNETIEWTEANLLLNTLNPTFWVYPNLTWYDNESYEFFLAVSTKLYDQYEGVDDIELSGFVLYCKEIWQRIMSNLEGLTASETWFNTYFDFLGIAVPLLGFLEGYGKVAAISAAVADAPDTNVSTIEKLKFATTLTDPAGLWQPSPDFEFLVITTGLGKIIVDLTVEVFPQPVGDTNTNYIRLYKNADVIQSWILPYDANVNTFTTIQWQVITYLSAGDILYLEAETQSSVFGPIKFRYTDDQFQLIFGESNTEVIISEVVPEISQKDFVKSILQQMHLIPTTVGTEVNFVLWEDIINQSPKLLKDKVSADKDVIESNFLENYGQNNWFRYAPDKNVLRTDMDSSIQVLNETLPLNVDKIELIYNASDDTIIPTLLGAPLIGKATVPAFSFEYAEIVGNKIQVKAGNTLFTWSNSADVEAGDVIVIRQSNITYRMRVQIMTSPTSGNFKFPFPGSNGTLNWQIFKYVSNETNLHILTQFLPVEQIQIVNGDGTPPSNLGAYASGFVDEQLWVNLIGTYYLSFAKSIEKPWVIQTFVYLTVKEFNVLNSLSPIWLSEAGEYFYLNKMEQFKQNQLTRIELFRLYSEPI